jgi:hypothetical protein
MNINDEEEETQSNNNDHGDTNNTPSLTIVNMMGPFRFKQHLPSSEKTTKTSFTFESSPEEQALYTKWNLLPGFKVRTFQVEPRFLYEKEHPQVLRDLFRDPAIIDALGLGLHSAVLQQQLPENEYDEDDLNVNVTATRLSCQATSMSFFNCLKDRGIVAEDGTISPCMPDYLDGVMVYDELRKMLLGGDSGGEGGGEGEDNSESEHHNNMDALFSNNDKKELLFHLMRLLCVGGAMCQAEDNFLIYKASIKRLYKELVTVQKKKKYTTEEEKGAGAGERGNQVEVVSTAYSIEQTSSSNSSWRLFPTNDCHNSKQFNSCYAILCQRSSTVTIVYKAYEPFW